MQLDSYPNTVDPRLLSLNEYTIPYTNTAHAQAVADEDIDDDIAIASGQVDLEDGVGSPGTYNGIEFDEQSDLAAELDLTDQFDIRYSLLKSSVSTFLTDTISQWFSSFQCCPTDEGLG